jgi:hypothetical protein
LARDYWSPACPTLNCGQQANALIDATHLESSPLKQLIDPLTEHAKLSSKPRTPKEWAALLRPYVSTTWSRSVWSGAIGRDSSKDGNASITT